MEWKPGTTKHCYFDECVSDSRYGPKVDFIHFPKPCLAVRKKIIQGDKAHLKDCSLCLKCKNWLGICKRATPVKDISTVNRYKYLCVNHFANGIGPTDIYPYPMPYKEVLRIRQSPRTRGRNKRCGSNEESHETIPTKQIREDIATGTVGINVATESSTGVQTSVQSLGMENESSIKVELSTTLMIPDETPYKEDPDETPYKEEPFRENYCQTTHVKMKDRGQQTVFTYKDNEALKDEIVTLKKQVRALEARCKISERSSNLKRKSQTVTEFVENLKTDDKKCQFYTNLIFPQIVALYTFLQPTENLIYCNTKKTKSPNKKRLLTQLEELILTLVRLRTGLVLYDLSYRFNISTNYISTTLTTWIQHCFYKFEAIDFREIINEVGERGLNCLVLKEILEERYALPPNSYYLTLNGKIIESSIVLENGNIDSLRMVPRVSGGKGGLGSLRAAGAQTEKSTNREACRDLSGRQLRDIAEEQRIDELDEDLNSDESTETEISIKLEDIETEANIELEDTETGVSIKLEDIETEANIKLGDTETGVSIKLEDPETEVSIALVSI